MKTLILFASRYGATEEIAYMLKSAVGGDVTVRNIRERGITLDGIRHGHHRQLRVHVQAR